MTDEKTVRSRSGDKPSIHVREISTRRVVHSVPWTGALSERLLERVVMGMLRNLDAERFYVDDREVKQAVRDARSRDGGAK